MLREHADGGRRPRDLLATAFARADLPAAVQRDVAGAVYRCVQQARRLAFALGGEARARSAATRLAACLLLDGRIDLRRAERLVAEAGDPRVDWPLVLAVDERIARLDDAVRRFGLRHSMPDWLAARFGSEFGDDADRVAAALNEPAPRTIRANTLRVDGREALARALDEEGVATRPTRFAPHGLHVEGDVPLFALPSFRRGEFEQQDEASQLAAEIVAPPPRGRVLDACAGSGGKALAIAALLRNRGELLALDVHERRLDELVARRRRAGVDVVRALPTAADGWPAEAEDFARRADRMLLDVPCSGVGSWRRRPDARWALRPQDESALVAVQQELLERAIARARVGARIVYSTCTLFRAENEERIERALAAHPGLELVRVAEILGKARAAAITDETGTFLRLWPHRHGTDGFFGAVLRRRV